MTISKNDNTTVVELDYDPRTATLFDSLEEVMYERSKGLTASSVIGILHLLIDKFKKDQGF